MQPTPQIALQPLPTPSNGFVRNRPVEDLAYQIVTLAAILLVIGSLWLF
jgi:hypothetical protein